MQFFWVGRIKLISAFLFLFLLFALPIASEARADGWIGTAVHRIAARVGWVTRRTARKVIRVGRVVGRGARRVIRTVVVQPGRKALRVAREVVAVGLGQAEIDRLLVRGYKVKRRGDSKILRQSVTRIEIPEGSTVETATREIGDVAPLSRSVDNALYYRMALTTYETTGEPCRDQCPAFEHVNWLPDSGQCQVPHGSIGVIDTSVDTAHPSLVGADVMTAVTRSPERDPSSTVHGTGVVSLLVGRSDSPVVGVVQGAKIIAADAFHSIDGHDAADVYDLVMAMDWLVDQGVTVINLSISGPDNPLLEQAVERALVRGITIVAAAGKPETSSVGYPGRYPGVVAVSGVDQRLRPSRLSLKGRHIAFAAPGVGLTVAGSGGSTVQVDGTSFAAPFVAAAFAMTAGGSHEERERSLRARARDLGPPGRDSMYGWGLIQFPRSSGC